MNNYYAKAAAEVACPGKRRREICIFEKVMKKKENLWELLKRLDEQAAQFNHHLHKANHYFDSAATATNKALDRHEKELHKLIGKVKKSLKAFMKENEKKVKKHDK